MDERSKKDYTEYYDIIKIIGTGAFGCVYKGKMKETTNQFRAIKVISFDEIKKNLLFQYKLDEIDKELKKCINGYIEEFENMKLCSINNENSVKCYEYFINEENFVIIMELCDTDLSKILLNKLLKEKKGFNVNEIYEIMKQLNKAFQIMRENKIIHRDLKLENILIKYIDKNNNNYKLKLADYGSSKRIDSFSSKRIDSFSKNYLDSFIGTLVYMSPEILKREKYNYKCDLWSIGIIIYNLLFGKTPFFGETETALINNIDNFNNILLTSSGNEELDNLLKNLLEKEHAKRLGWEEYFKHPFFKDKNINCINCIYITNKEEINLINDIRIRRGLKYNEKEMEEKMKLIEENMEIYIKNQKQEFNPKYKTQENEKEINVSFKIKPKFIELICFIFSNCSSLKSIDLSSVDTNNFITMACMFYNCSSLESINLSSFKTNKVIDMSYMFYNCSSLKSIDLSSFKTNNVIDMSYMFSNCSSLESINLSKFETFKVENMKEMFSNCSRLKSIDLSSFNTDNVKDITAMFSNCSSLESLNLSSFNTNKVTDLIGMFSHCSSLKSIDLSSFNTRNVRNMSFMFSHCSSLTSLDLSSFNTINSESMFRMFYGCSLLEEIDLSNFYTFKCEHMTDMFLGCYSIKSCKTKNDELWKMAKKYSQYY